MGNVKNRGFATPNEYPTDDAIKNAGPLQIRKWYINLPPPKGEEQIAKMKQIIKLNRAIKNLVDK